MIYIWQVFPIILYLSEVLKEIRNFILTSFTFNFAFFLISEVSCAEEFLNLEKFLILLMLFEVFSFLYP